MLTLRTGVLCWAAVLGLWSLACAVKELQEVVSCVHVGAALSWCTVCSLQHAGLRCPVAHHKRGRAAGLGCTWRASSDPVLGQQYEGT